MTWIQDPARLAVRVDPTLAEAAVRSALTGFVPARLEAFEAHQQRAGRCYEIDDQVERDAAFARLALAEFDELGLAEPLRHAVAERPPLARRVRVILAGEARGPVDEGVTCESGGQHLGVRVSVARLGDPGELLAWARHAMGHAEDTLDPTFRFEPGWDGSGGLRAIAAATQSRVHRLWDVTVDARLVRAGRLGELRARQRHHARIAADLPGVAPGTIDAVLDRLWDGARPAFPELLAWAARPADLVAAVAPGDPGFARPDRCPLCRFPSDDVVPPERAIADVVAADYPDWRPEHGLCGRCTDRYRFAGRLGGRG